MKQLFLWTFFLFAIIILIAIVTVGGSFVGLWHYSFFAPRIENVRRNVFEQTQSYTEGKRQELAKYHLEYTRSKDPVEKEAIATMIRSSFANVDFRDMNYQDQQFLNSVNN